jgi:hypothetical protein
MDLYALIEYDFAYKTVKIYERPSCSEFHRWTYHRSK